jgi:lipoprotein
MRSLIILFVTCALVGCKSQKNVVASQSVNTDSLAHSEHHRTMAVIDSVVRNIDFSFDTLKINIERPVQYAEAPEIIRLTATKGRVIDRRSAQRDSVEAFNRLDTVAYHQSAAESSTEHSATTRLYNPPDGTAVLVIALVIAGILFYVFYRKR